MAQQMASDPVCGMQVEPATAEAKGLTARVVRGRHVLRNAMLPVVTTVGLQVGALLSGAVLTETVFSFRGVGRS